MGGPIIERRTFLGCPIVPLIDAAISLRLPLIWLFKLAIALYLVDRTIILKSGFVKSASAPAGDPNPIRGRGGAKKLRFCGANHEAME